LIHHLLRRTALGAAAALAVTSLSATAAQAAPGDGGTLIVTIVDQYGQPVPASVIPIDPSGQAYYTGANGPFGAFNSTVVIPQLDAGGYSLLALTAFGGETCAGIAPCSIPGDPAAQGASFTPVVTVADDATSTYRITVAIPSIAGASPVGSTLSAVVPQGLTDLEDAFARQSASAPPGQIPNFKFVPDVQWLRGGTEIPGATGRSYTTTVADAGQAVTARFDAASGNGYFAALGGSKFSLRSNAIAVARAATSTTVKLLGKARPGKKVSALVSVASGATQASGVVALSVGGKSVAAALQNGVATIKLPKLKAKKYVATATFAGGAQFAPSTSTALTFKVKPAKAGGKKKGK
jgi:HSP20 family molecular chaperone IbpA